MKSGLGFRGLVASGIVENNSSKENRSKLESY